MIIEDYAAFRIVANPGGTLGVDGLPEFVPANMRKNGFSGGFSVSSTSSFPIQISCIPTVAYAGFDDFDWYVSQRTSVSENKPFAVERFSPEASDTIVLDLAAWAAIEYPDPFDLSAIRTLFRAVDIYCIRRDDLAIQRLDLMQYLLDVLSPKTGIE